MEKRLSEKAEAGLKAQAALGNRNAVILLGLAKRGGIPQGDVKLKSR